MTDRGMAVGWLRHWHYAPNGEPWCRFGRGWVCLNGDLCHNPRHRY